MVRQESRPHNTGSASGRLTCILGPDSNRDCPSIQVQSRWKVWCSPSYRQVEKTPAVVGRRNQCEGERECVRPVPPPAVVGTCSSRLSRDVTCPPLVHRLTNNPIKFPRFFQKRSPDQQPHQIRSATHPA
jgi:hypothetical protein